MDVVGIYQFLAPLSCLSPMRPNGRDRAAIGQGEDDHGWIRAATEIRRGCAEYGAFGPGRWQVHDPAHEISSLEHWSTAYAFIQSDQQSGRTVLEIAFGA